ncbi:dihydrofolate reductase [Candidatus Berkelbacteria bacterium]|nr:dihydrofolate reductase [Candidatus Berkelbacteria bacterium]
MNKEPIISIISAVDRKRGIGKNNKLLWDIPEDLQRFRTITSGHPIIMGRKTFESIGRPLPKRTNIVVMHRGETVPEGVIACYSMQEAIAEAKKHDTQEIFIIGGGQIYALGLQYADKLYLTVVDGEFEADTYFPDYSAFGKVVSQVKSHDDHHNYTFYELTKP